MGKLSTFTPKIYCEVKENESLESLLRFERTWYYALGKGTNPSPLASAVVYIAR